MTYYEIVDGKIGRYTDNEHIAALNGLTLTTNDEIVFGADGERYLASQCPPSVRCNENGAIIVQVAGGFEIQKTPEPIPVEASHTSPSQAI